MAIPEGGCIHTLRSYLGSVFFVNFALNAVEVGKPLLSYLKREVWQRLWRKRDEEGDVPRSKTSVEDQYNFDAYESDALIEEYMELIMQFCFVTFFSGILPIIPLLAWVSNLVEIRSDAFKLLVLHRRIFPASATGIGGWNGILKFITTWAVLLNIGLSIFVLNAAGDLELTHKLLVFMIVEHISVFVMMFLRAVVPEESYEARFVLNRMAAVRNEALFTDN